MSIIFGFTLESGALQHIGGKGVNLVRLFRAGFPVPGGFIIATQAYRDYVNAHALGEKIATTLANLPAERPDALEIASSAIRHAFSEGTMPKESARATVEAYQTMNKPAVAVRSSATMEDLPRFSFAGQQETYLNVIGEEALLKAVVNCWSSLWTARAIGYRVRNHIAHDDAALAVVVQQMVQSEASGVMFTANPLNGARTEIVIEGTLGLGEALVSGQVDPDNYVVDVARKKITAKTLGAKAMAMRGKVVGGTVTQEQNSAHIQALPNAQIIELAELGKRVEREFGSPQDIEWAWAEGRLFVLQSRAITTL